VRPRTLPAGSVDDDEAVAARVAADIDSRSMRRSAVGEIGDLSDSVDPPKAVVRRNGPEVSTGIAARFEHVAAILDQFGKRGRRATLQVGETHRSCGDGVADGAPRAQCICE
jgi:hypothetical protein